MSAAESKSVVRRLYEAINANDLDGALALVADDMVTHTPVPGIDQHGKLRKPAKAVAQPAVQQQYRWPAAIADKVNVGPPGPDPALSMDGCRGHASDQVTPQICGDGSQNDGSGENDNHGNAAEKRDATH